MTICFIFAKNQQKWAFQPKIIRNKHTQDAILLVFGKPKTAVFAHVDTVGFTAGYGSDLIKVGSPAIKKSDILVGEDKLGEFKCKVTKVDNQWHYLLDRAIERGTPLSYKPHFKETKDFVEGNYMDNRLGVFVALQLAETLKNGVIAFTTYEEVGGGNAERISIVAIPSNEYLEKGLPLIWYGPMALMPEDRMAFLMVIYTLIGLWLLSMGAVYLSVADQKNWPKFLHVFKRGSVDD